MHITIYDGIYTHGGFCPTIKAMLDYPSMLLIERSHFWKLPRIKNHGLPCMRSTIGENFDVFHFIFL